MRDEFYVSKPVLKQGDPIGWLTITEWGAVRCRCVCKCGEPVTRNTHGLNAARLKSQEPKCKKCEKSERKRKNPGGGVGTKSLRSDVLAYSGVLGT